MVEKENEVVLHARPIGHIRTAMHTKFAAPHQPEASGSERNIIELLPGHNFEQALSDLEGFERVWLLWWFHKNSNWNPKVLPPRGGGQKRGVFATRSPHRPNLIGLTCVELVEVRGRRIIVGPVDLVDGTPILDIKPYIPEIDSFAHARAGWVDGLTQELAKGESQFEVRCSDDAVKQRDWLLQNFQIDFLTRAIEILSQDPSPHRTRRIVAQVSGFRMSCGAWRVFFDVRDKLVTVERVAPGYPKRSLSIDSKKPVPDRDAQIAFLIEWPEEL